MGYFKYVLLALLFCSFVAEATLIRNAGRASQTSTSPQSYYWLDQRYISADGYVNSNFTDSPYDRISFTSGQLPLLAVPDCWRITDLLPPPEFWQEDPCYYQFYLGEALQFSGNSYWFMDMAPQYEVSWTLSDGISAWNFSGYKSESYYFLDSPMPANLTPGEYALSVSVTFFAGDNYAFFYDGNDRLDCQPVYFEEGDLDCYYFHWSRLANDQLTFTSPIERVQILNRPSAEVPVPATLILLLVGLGLLAGRTLKVALSFQRDIPIKLSQ